MSDSLDVICYALGEYANKLFNYRMKNDVKYFQLLAVTQSVNLLKHRSWAINHMGLKGTLLGYLSKYTLVILHVNSAAPQTHLFV